MKQIASNMCIFQDFSSTNVITLFSKYPSLAGGGVPHAAKGVVKGGG